MGDLVYLNVGGKKYITSYDTINVVPDSMLAKMVASQIPTKKIGQYIFIDRNGELFGYILDYLRQPNDWKLPKHVDRASLKSEADFFLLASLQKLLEEPSFPVVCLMLERELKGDSFTMIAFPPTCYKGKFLHKKGDFGDVYLKLLKIMGNLTTQGYQLKAMTNVSMLMTHYIFERV